MFDDLIGLYGAFGPAALRERLSELLRQAAARLGPPNDQSDLSDPTFMAVHALNLLDPRNWPEVSVVRDDGTQTAGRQYASPAAEREHFEHLQQCVRERHTATNMQAAIGLALDNPSRSSPAFAAASVSWAQNVAPTLEEGDTDAEWMREEAVFSAAMIAMRDGDAELRSKHAVWAHSIFAQDIDAIALTPIISLPDEPFFDVVTGFLRSLDAVFCNEHGLASAGPRPHSIGLRSSLDRNQRLASPGG